VTIANDYCWRSSGGTPRPPARGSRPAPASTNRSWRTDGYAWTFPAGGGVYKAGVCWFVDEYDSRADGTSPIPVPVRAPGVPESALLSYVADTATDRLVE